MTNEEIWRQVLNEMELNLPKAAFNTWFKNTAIVSNKEGVVTIGVPHAFAQEWLSDKFNKNILKSLRSILSDIKEVKFSVTKTAAPAVAESPESIQQKISHISSNSQEEFDVFSIDKQTNLNPRYLFDAFIVGESNRLAHASAVAVSNAPGTAYNPLFIYGGTGLGKTHLIQAIGNTIKNKNKKIQIKYVPSEVFTTEIIGAIQNNTMSRIKEHYRQFDVLIIDDIQFLAGKEKTQEEFFHIFNSLYENNKQIIVSSDRPPKAIAILEERLKSRFEGGMIADISAPDYETRMAILRAKMEQKKQMLEEDIIQYLATNIQKNIRELEGALNRIAAYTNLYKKQPTREDISTLLSNLINPPRKLPAPKKVIEIVADFYQLKEKDLITSSRKQEIVKPRQIAMYLLREELKSSYPYIGQKLGGKDHTTVIHACEKITKELKINKNLEDELQEIREKMFS
jgi:chromosomal replication initiator protein